MVSFKASDTGDFAVENGIIQLVDGIEEVKQLCEQAMRQRLGELYYAKSKGIDYFGNVFSGTYNSQLFEAQARQQLLNVQGVISITSFTSEQLEDELKYTAEITTEYGRIAINEQL